MRTADVSIAKKVQDANGVVILDVLGEFKYKGVDYYTLVCSDGVPRTFYKKDWSPYTDPAARAKASEAVCKALNDYTGLRGSWADVLKNLDAWAALA